MTVTLDLRLRANPADIVRLLGEVLGKQAQPPGCPAPLPIRICLLARRHGLRLTAPLPFIMMTRRFLAPVPRSWTGPQGQRIRLIYLRWRNASVLAERLRKRAFPHSRISADVPTNALVVVAPPIDG